MPTKRIKFGLSESSVLKAIDELKAYKKWTQKKCDELSFELAKQGMNLIRLKIAQHGALDTGELISSVQWPKKIGPGKYAVTLNVKNAKGHNYALFVEYGTGPKGKGAKHPAYGEVGWDYDVGQHIFDTKDGRRGWIYPTRDGSFRFTEGQISHPFWHDAAQELPDYIYDTARKVFSHD